MKTTRILLMIAGIIGLSNCTYVEPSDGTRSSSSTTTTTTDHLTGAESTTEETTTTYR
ncbi:hypothetical protein [Luteolibacter luteus]|uniref:Uncharacterized protein n=1 Tax=Luteolibacter luteus TaxID=2728835 RepID=A0A858RL40_9BACT|nr:hypothetical protein [Luteolibacter luteus]QJE97455.1 hypothetical protein HHL09_17235 [Luteolibacter luteus]